MTVRSTAAALFFFASAPAFAAAVDLRITLLGTGNPRPSVERFGPSSLVELPGTPGARLLVDAGRGATTRLFQVGQAPLLAGVDCVVLTHLHSDHVVGLPDLWLTGWIFGRERPLVVHGPAGTRAMTEALKRAFDFDVKMRRDVDEKLPAKGAELEGIEVEAGKPFSCGTFTVTAFRVDHGPVAPAFGYRVEAKGRVVVFSGDTRASDAVAEAARGADVLVHEVASPDAERRLAQVKGKDRIERILARHTAPEDAGRIFAKAKPRLAVYSHVVPSPAIEDDLVPPTRTTYQGPLEVGEDLMVIEVGETVTVRRPSRRER